MTLLTALTNLGALPADANVLESFYANQDIGEFLNGLEEVAKALVSKQLNSTVPLCNPWQTIYSYMVATGSPDQGLLDGTASLDPAVQISITGVISCRVREIQQYQGQLSASGSKRKKTADYIKLLDHLGYKFSYNECRQTIEINRYPITDELMMTIRTQVRDAGIMEVNIVEDAYGAEAWKNRYHPVKDYLQDLNWEGKDTISELAACFDDEKNVISIFLRRWLVGAVARVMCSAQNRMLILDGPQGIGKSQLVKWLGFPLEEFCHEGQINPDDKDSWIRLIGTWIWEVNEFGSTARKADRERLKGFLTTETVKVRKPYAHTDTIGRAMTSFIGTTNNESGLLSDPTGSRRFMVARLKTIDWNYKNIDIDQVWAQAYALYLANEPWNLTPDEYQKANDINEDYQVVDMVEETIKRHFEIDTAQPTWKMSTIEIMEQLKDPAKGNLRSGTDLDARRLAAAMTKLGMGKPVLIRFGSIVMRGYVGIKIRLP